VADAHGAVELVFGRHGHEIRRQRHGEQVIPQGVSLVHRAAVQGVLGVKIDRALQLGAKNAAIKILGLFQVVNADSAMGQGFSFGHG